MQTEESCRGRPLAIAYRFDHLASEDRFRARNTTDVDRDVRHIDKGNIGYLLTRVKRRYRHNTQIMENYCHHWRHAYVALCSGGVAVCRDGRAPCDGQSMQTR